MNSMIFTADIENPMKLEVFLRRDKQVSRRFLAKCKYHGSITRDGRQIRTIDTVYPGDVITLSCPSAKCTALPNTSLRVPVLYRSEHIIVYNKPPFMPCHQSYTHYTDTLANAFASEFPDIPFRCVTRLDRNTSGVCIVALTAYGAGFIQKKIKKQYIAAAKGKIINDGTIDAPIARKDGTIMLRCVNDSGKSAVTHYIPICLNDKYTLVKLVPETGRTHQLRVHMAYIGHPLAGDDLYGTISDDISRHALHCYSAEFPEPESGKMITVNAPLPEDIKALFSDKNDLLV